jgi:Sec-independent protein secretion pathway component TatC
MENIFSILVIVCVIYILFNLIMKIVDKDFPKWAKLSARKKWNIKFLDKNIILKRVIIFLLQITIFFIVCLIVMFRYAVNTSWRFFSKRLKI